MYSITEASKDIQETFRDVSIASTRCPICSYKRKVVDSTTIYCPIHGYMDRVFEDKSKDIKH